MIKHSTKQDLRKFVKDERKKIDIKSISKNLLEKLIETADYKEAKNIMIFYPLKYEVDLLEILNDDTKNFYLPRVEGETLLCCPFKKDTELSKSCFKINEPLTKAVDKTILDLIVVPALAVDRNNYRLGYGRGFYDRFLKDLDCKKIVCISKDFILDTVYPEDYDIKIDYTLSI